MKVYLAKTGTKMENRIEKLEEEARNNRQMLEHIRDSYFLDKVDEVAIKAFRDETYESYKNTRRWVKIWLFWVGAVRNATDSVAFRFLFFML